MKKVKYPSGHWKLILVCLFIFSSPRLWAQSIQAGMHQGNEHFVDFNPDSSFQAVHNGPSANFYLDLNGDGHRDFQLYGSNGGGLGGNTAGTSIIPQDSNAVAFGFYDSCFGMAGFIFASSVTKSFSFGEVIDQNADWKKTSLSIANNSYVMNSYNCNLGHGGGQLFLGLRLFTDTDTIYGWLRLESFSAGSFTVGAYACTALSSNQNELVTKNTFQISPNPAKDWLNIKVIEKENFEKIKILDGTGKLIWEESTLNRTVIPILVSEWAAGFYMVQFQNNKGELINSKFLIAR
jgi:hypothetical protein